MIPRNLIQEKIVLFWPVLINIVVFEIHPRNGVFRLDALFFKKQAVGFGDVVFIDFCQVKANWLDQKIGVIP